MTSEADFRAKGFAPDGRGGFFKPRRQARVVPHRQIHIAFAEETETPDRLADSLHLVIVGQIRGGKNNITITRTGHRYPNKSWARWRDDAVRQIQAQLPVGFTTITTPVNVTLAYVAGDKRRRDMPAIIDAIFSVFERAKIVSDDSLCWIGHSTRSYDRAQPGATMELRC